MTSPDEIDAILGTAPSAPVPLRRRSCARTYDIVGMVG